MAYNQILPNYVGDVQNAYDQGRARKQRSNLEALAGDFYQQQGDPMLAEMARNSPEAAMKFQGVQNDAQERQKAELGELASYLVAAPAPMKAAAYARIYPKLRQLVPEAPPEYSPEVDEIAQWAAQTYGRAGKGATGVQGTFVDSQGNRVAIMRDGSTQVLGQNAPNNQIIAADGGYFGVNKGNLSAAPVMIGGQPQAPQPTAPPPGNNDALLATANQMVKAGVPPEYVEKWLSQQPGIMPVSDAAPEPQMPAAPVGQQLRPAPKAAGGPAELERRVAMARQMGASEEQIKAMVVGGGQAGNTQTQKNSQAMNVKKAQLGTIERQISRLESISNAIGQNTVFDGGPLDQFALKFGKQGQELDQAGASILPVLTALTRVPGVGAQSDLESRLQKLQIPDSSMHPEVRAEAIKALREYMNDLRAAFDAQPAAGATNKPEPANGGWSIKAKP